MLTIILYVLMIGFLACCAFGVVAITVKLCIDFVKFVKSEPGTALAFLVPLAVLVISLIIGSYVMAGAMTLICGYTGLQMLVAFADFADDQMFPNRRIYSSGYSGNSSKSTIEELRKNNIETQRMYLATRHTFQQILVELKMIVDLKLQKLKKYIVLEPKVRTVISMKEIENGGFIYGCN